ncbi:MAG TPA: methyltransferase domain-containing protein [Candidatus Eisenbacteria bacterium]|jgi:SAM-dependent methyltransferase
MEEPWGEQITREWVNRFPIAPYRRRLIEEQAPQGTRALDAGSGPAHDSLPLAERGFRVTGVDLSRNGLLAGRSLYAREGKSLDAARADVRALPFRDGSFDFVWNAGVLEHFEDADVLRVLREMRRVARPGGVVLAVVPNRFYFWYQAHLAFKRLLGREHQYSFERAYDARYLVRRFREAGFEQVDRTGIHIHPAPSFLVPKTGFLTRLLARLFAPLEAAGRRSAWRALAGLDLVVWARK